MFSSRSCSRTATSSQASTSFTDERALPADEAVDQYRSCDILSNLPTGGHRYATIAAVKSHGQQLLTFTANMLDESQGCKDESQRLTLQLAGFRDMEKISRSIRRRSNSTPADVCDNWMLSLILSLCSLIFSFSLMPAHRPGQWLHRVRVVSDPCCRIKLLESSLAAHSSVPCGH